MRDDDLDQPLPGDQRLAVELARLVDGRPDPSQNVHPPGSGALDVLACIDGQEQLDRMI